MRWADPKFETERQTARQTMAPVDAEWTPTAPDPALLKLLNQRRAGLVQGAPAGVELV